MAFNAEEQWVPWEEYERPSDTVQDAIYRIHRESNSLNTPTLTLLRCALGLTPRPRPNTLEHIAYVTTMSLPDKEKENLQGLLLGTHMAMSAEEQENLDKFIPALDNFLAMNPCYNWGVITESADWDSPDLQDAWLDLMRDLTWDVNRSKGPNAPLMVGVDPQVYYDENGRFIYPRAKLERRIRAVMRSAMQQLFFYLGNNAKGNPMEKTLRELEKNLSPEEMMLLRWYGHLSYWESTPRIMLLDEMAMHGGSVTWDQLIAFQALIQEYNLEWALAAMDWSGDVVHGEAIEMKEERINE